MPNGEAIDAARDTMLATLYDVAAHPITDAEVERVRTKAQKDFDDTINDPEQIGRRAGRCRSRRATGASSSFSRDRWRTVTAADVTRVARRSS